MSVIRSASAALAVASLLCSGMVLAQTPAPSDNSKPSPVSSAVDDVSKWTSKEWNRARIKWAKEKDKWADCEKHTKEQKLSGRKSWSFLASCMTN
jgi:hypothetical protein